MEAYTFLETAFKEASILESIKSMLSWDTNVLMPTNSINTRIEQITLLSELSHKKIFNTQIKDKLKEALASNDKLNEWQQANLKRMQKAYSKYEAVDQKLLQAFEEATAKCEMIWRTAKANNDFKSFEPSLDEVISLNREIAAAKAEYYGLKPYEALLDDYDEGRKTEQIDNIFNKLKDFLPDFIENVRSKQGLKPDLSGHYEAKQQEEFARKIMTTLGFDFTKGRLDISAHPFCGGIPQDIRLTTAYDEKDLFSGLCGVIHETGHAMYTGNLPKEYIYQPVGAHLGMSIHESQSLFFEMQVSRSDEFLEFIQPLIVDHFRLDSTKFSLSNMKKYVRYVEPSFIRIDADEVTYPLHVILRYELEKKILAGDLKTKDLPLAWNESFKKLFGITPPTDALGCMQDIHWSIGSFGYFPCYTLGAIIAAQVMYKVKTSITNIAEEIKNGNFTPLNEWLKLNIHSKGSLYSVSDTLKLATGEDINLQYFTDYLKQRYLSSN